MTDAERADRALRVARITVRAFREHTRLLGRRDLHWSESWKRACVMNAFYRRMIEMISDRYKEAE